jgi:DNA invertase Pin-like site-specific DNA recombinase
LRIGYARVSTREQSFDLQVDALRAAGCEKIYSEAVSGARTERPVLEELLRNIRSGDVLVIWKLDRLGRSLRHLVDLVGILIDKGIGLQSLHDPVDTTTPHGRFTFNLFASLAEFERDLIRERTQAGLSAARARGRNGGRPKGITPQAEETAMAAETQFRLYSHLGKPPKSSTTRTISKIRPMDHSFRIVSNSVTAVAVNATTRGSSKS